MSTDLDTAATTWRTGILPELKLSMTAATFNTWLLGSHVVAVDGDTWTVAVRHPHAVDWLTNRMMHVVERPLHHRHPGASVEFVAAGNGNGETPAAAPAPAPATAPELPAEPQPQPSAIRHEPRDTDAILEAAAFDPGSAGWWQAGHYATWYWAPLLGPVAWRVYELVVAEDKRRNKTLWTPPRRYSVSDLARAVASGRGGRPNRNQIRGRWRTDRKTGERIWRPGAFDTLVEHQVGIIEWHDGSGHWQAWLCGGFERQGRSGLRVIYRASVVTHLPLLTPHQVDLLTPDHQVNHERYLAERGVDLAAWNQIAVPTLAGAAGEKFHPTGARDIVTGAQGTVNGAEHPFFTRSAGARTP